MDRFSPPYKTAGAVFLVIVAGVAALIYAQFRGTFADRTELTVVASRAGLVVDPGSKVTLNGVEVGQVVRIGTTPDGAGQDALLTLEVDPRYLDLIPANIVADITASTVFGNKYVAFSSPENPSAQHVSSGSRIDAKSVTTEFNTLFETVTEIAQQVDPVKLNQTLTATAEALTGLGDRFGESLEKSNRVFAELNPQMPRIRADISRTAQLADVYADASANLFDGLTAAVTTARTVNAHERDLDEALMAAVGFANTAQEPLELAAPYLARGAADLVPTTQLLDEYRGMILCTIRNYHDVQPLVAKTLGGNGYSLAQSGTLLNFGAGNPYVYPDNLPRINAHGGPEGRPGCWQKITKELYPFPYLVMDTGFNLAPYNHWELGQPIVVDYVWGRQVGEYTINP